MCEKMGIFKIPYAKKNIFDTQLYNKITFFRHPIKQNCILESTLQQHDIFKVPNKYFRFVLSTITQSPLYTNFNPLFETSSTYKSPLQKDLTLIPSCLLNFRMDFIVKGGIDLNYMKKEDTYIGEFQSFNMITRVVFYENVTGYQIHIFVGEKSYTPYTLRK